MHVLAKVGLDFRCSSVLCKWSLGLALETIIVVLNVLILPVCLFIYLSTYYTILAKPVKTETRLL